VLRFFSHTESGFVDDERGKSVLLWSLVSLTRFIESICTLHNILLHTRHWPLGRAHPMTYDETAHQVGMRRGKWLSEHE
jgi:hypothetical protein